MEIIDINGAKRQVCSIRKTMYSVPDAVNGGTASFQPYIEVIIVGRTGRTWKEWIPLDKFIENNPNIVIE